MFGLSLLNQVFHRTGNVFDRHVGIDSVLVEQIDDVRSQALQRRVRNLPDALRAAVQTLLGIAVFETEFGRDDDVFPERLNRLADEFFVL